MTGADRSNVATAGPRRPPGGSKGAALLVVLALGVLAGCGNDERTALAIDDVRWRDKTSLVVSTECATDIETEVGPDHSGTGLPEVTVWGDPSMGTCRPTSVVVLPDGATRIVDGTTSMVIDLPARP